MDREAMIVSFYIRKSSKASLKRGILQEIWMSRPKPRKAPEGE